ncbi:MAG: rod shape-determining protein MreC [Actinobacteria bacterium]|nr:rod shape-determining protein MreC [Actinomycetota bacterium]
MLVLASITILTLDYRGDLKGTISGVKSAAHDVIAPVDSAVDAVLRPIGSFFEGALHYGAAERENALLRHENGALRRKATELAVAEGQVRSLLRQDHLPWVGSLPTVQCQVIALSASNFELTVELDKGTADGIAVGMPVVSGSGLVGQVIETSATRSTVLLITDPRSAVSVALDQPTVSPKVSPTTGSHSTLSATTTGPGTSATKSSATTTTSPGSTSSNAVKPPASSKASATSSRASTSPTNVSASGTASGTSSSRAAHLLPTYVQRAIGLLSGQGSGKPLTVDYVAPGTAITPGAEVVTTGLQGALYPPDLPVGTVIAVRHPADALQETVLVRPAANFFQLDFLSVIIWEPAP